MHDAGTAEEQFYSRYSWCLNPALSVKDLLRRFEEELDQYESLTGWQREESKANLYLFVCAIACTADDYLALRWIKTGRLRAWRRHWNVIVEQCRILMSDDDCGQRHFTALRSASLELLRVNLPAALLKRRMRVPEEFRSQHTAHGRVAEIELSNGQEIVTKKVIFKSVGRGWLGYHAYISGKRLEGFVPPVLGLRNGLLVSEWIDDASPNRVAVSNERMVRTIASYVAARSRRLPLGDCCLDRLTYRWTDSGEILEILRKVYGPYLNRLKMPALRKLLHKYVTSVPTLIDGKMGPQEWIHSGAASYKCNFDYHNFGRPEADIVDPAYDLAAAIFEFRFSKSEEEKLLRGYAEESGDTSIRSRILLHKILYGAATMKSAAAAAAAAGKDGDRHNELCQFARNFLTYAMNDFSAELIAAPKMSRWCESLFFMDLDGVFDQELLGFPHATLSGLQSLALLHSNGFAVVLNTGRSIQHVRRYCEAYGLAGGVAEFGAVFVDAVHQREIPIVDGIGSEQLGRCREYIRNVPGVFMDPGYEYSIRLYRYQGNATAGLKPEEIKDILKNAGCRNLTFISRGADSYIVQKRTSKGAAVGFVKRYTGNSNPVTAVGDSQYDIGMLKAAEHAYAPANCTPLMRQLAKEGACRILRQRYQNGLLAAVQHRLGKQRSRAVSDLVKTSLMPDRVSPVMHMVLKAADRRFALQALIALVWWSL